MHRLTSSEAPSGYRWNHVIENVVVFAPHTIAYSLFVWRPVVAVAFTNGWHRFIYIFIGECSDMDFRECQTWASSAQPWHWSADGSRLAAAVALVSLVSAVILFASMASDPLDNRRTGLRCYRHRGDSNWTLRPCYIRLQSCQLLWRCNFADRRLRFGKGRYLAGGESIAWHRQSSRSNSMRHLGMHVNT